MAQLSTAQRISLYGLDAAKMQFNDLNVASGQRVTIQQGGLVPLHPETLMQLKEWVGVTDAVAKKSNLPRIQPRSNNDNEMFAANARQYLFRDSTQVPANLLPALQTWIWKLIVNWGLFAFNDIVLDSNAQLILGPDVLVLFAHRIAIHPTASIVVQGLDVKFDCAIYSSG